MYIGHASERQQRLHRVDKALVADDLRQMMLSGGGSDPQLPAIRKRLYQAYHTLFELRRVVCGRARRRAARAACDI